MLAVPTATGPIRVLTLDLADPRVEDASPEQQLWVVGCRDGVPLTLIEVDRSPAAPTLDAQLAALAAAHPAQDASWRAVPDDELPTATVVVPSMVRRLDGLETCLASLDALDYPDYDVVVADNRSEVPDPDPLAAMLAGRPRFRSVRVPRPGVAAARQAGTLAATGEVVAMTDDDVRVDRGWLRALGARFAGAPELWACTGLILPAELETPAQIYFERYYGGFAGERLFAPLTLRTGAGLLGRAQLIARDEQGREVRRSPLYGVGAYGAGANMALRRQAVLDVGGFDLALGTGTPAQGGEDLQILIDLLWAGGVVRYEPAAFVHHRHRRGYDELVRQLRAGGTGLTATLAALVVRDPRHLAGLAFQVPLAARRLAGQSLARIRGRRAGGDRAPAEDPLFPPELVQQELRGMPTGPLAYLRSRSTMRRWTRAHPQDPTPS
jgi:hypothetical protein